MRWKIVATIILLFIVLVILTILTITLRRKIYNMKNINKHKIIKKICDFFENKKLLFFQTNIKFFILYFFSVPFFYYIIGISQNILLNGFPEIDYLEIIITFFIISLFFTVSIYLFLETLINKEEIEVIAELLSNSFLPTAGLIRILLDSGDLDSILSFSGFNIEKKMQFIDYNNLLKGVALIFVPILFSAIYNLIKIYNNPIKFKYKSNKKQDVIKELNS